jgi:membrane-associated protease RseP (regulator of RpoE activity)
MKQNIGKRGKLIVICLSIAALLLLSVGIVAAQRGGGDGGRGRNPDRPFVGVMFAVNEATEGDAGGVVITEVIPGSPAETAGVQAGDIVTAVDGEAVTVETFADSILDNAIGDEVVFTITRAGESQDITVTLGSSMDVMGMPGDGMPGDRMPFGRRGGMPEGFNFEFGIPFGGRFGGGFGGDFETQIIGASLGAEFARLDEQAAAEFNVTETEGILVVRVSQDSPAAQAGLLAGDIITAINGEAVDADFSLGALLESLLPSADAAPNATEEPEADVQELPVTFDLVLDVLRDGETIQITVTLDAPMFVMPTRGFRFQFPIPDGSRLPGQPDTEEEGETQKSA